MSFKDIANKKSVGFYMVLQGAVEAEYSIDLKLNFMPDEFVIKNITYWSTVDESGFSLSFIYCDFIRDSSEPIGCISSSFNNATTSGYISNPDTRFLVANPISGQIKFLIKESTTGLIENVRDGQLYIQAEFLKYK